MEDDFFASHEPEEDVDPPAPTEEEIGEQNFNKGLSQTLGEEISEPTPEPVLEPEAAKALFAGMTEDELKTALESSRQQVTDLQEKFSQFNDKAFGTIGQLKQELSAIKTAKGEPISAEKFKAIADYFGDEGLAQIFAENLSGLQFGGPAEDYSGKFEELQTGFDTKLTEMRESMERDFNERILTIKHPDWQEISSSDEFQKWGATLTPEAQKMLNDSWDGYKLSQAFDSFKAWRDKKQQAAAEKTQRLENAVQPDGNSGGINHSAVDYFSEGMKEALGDRG